MPANLANDIFRILENKMAEEDISLNAISEVTAIKKSRLNALSTNRDAQLKYSEFELICCALAFLEKKIFKNFKLELGTKDVDLFLISGEEKHTIEFKTLKWFSALNLEGLKQNQKLDYAVIWSEREKSLRLYDLNKKRGSNKMEKYQAVLKDMNITFEKDINNAIDFIFDDEKKSLLGLKFKIPSVDDEKFALLDFYLSEDEITLTFNYPDYELNKHRTFEEKIQLNSEKELKDILKRYFSEWDGIELGNKNSQYKKIQVVEILSNYISSKRLYDQKEDSLSLDSALKALLNSQDEKMRSGDLYDRLRNVLRKVE
jgi:DNA-binding Xre family transcriptional regulator